MLAAVCGVQIFFVKRYVLLISACPGLGFCGTQPAADTPPGSFPQTFRGPAHHLSPRCRTSPCPLRAVLTSGLRLVPASPPHLTRLEMYPRSRLHLSFTWSRMRGSPEGRWIVASRRSIPARGVLLASAASASSAGHALAVCSLHWWGGWRGARAPQSPARSEKEEEPVQH